MADEHKAKRLEIAHVLFMDIVGYSKLLTDEQSEALQELNQIVRSTEAAREADAAGVLTVLPTGDGMALVFTGSVEEPVECALEISQALRAQPSLPVRMGIHSGPIHHVKDANGRENIAGIGINIAQRVMDCGDAGHILVSKRVADDLAQQRRWQPYIHELGDVEVKHGVVVSLVNLYAETIGNPTPPTRLGKTRGVSGSRVGTRKALSPLALAILIVAILLIALAIVLVIFAPAIMRTLDQRRLATLPQPTATAVPSLADTIKSAVAKQITDELQGELSRKKNAAAQPSPAGSAIPEKSIAVLPFDNLSRDPDNAFFAEGVQDEILTRLAKVADLKVIARTSTQKFKSSPENLPDIAKQLGVLNILEGSVQKANDQVRVNVQLINALTNSHLWAEIYDRKLTDIFAVESDIAKTIADTLQAKLTGNERSAIAHAPTEDPVAHELYLKGRHFWGLRGENLSRAIEFYNQAIARDPNYALAYAGLGETYILLPYYIGADPKDARPKARAATLKALELNPNLAEAHNAMGKIAYAVDIDLQRAIREHQRAIELSPNLASAHHWISNGPLSGLGRLDEAIAEGERSVELDPLSAINLVDLADTYMYARRFKEADAVMKKALEIDPEFAYAHWIYGILLQVSGDLEGARAQYATAHARENDAQAIALRAQLGAIMGRREEAVQALAALKELGKHQYVEAYYRALLYISLGQKDQALSALEQSYAERDGDDIGVIKVDPLLDSLRGDPRFEAVVQKVVAPKQ
jgi:adenylate cyclase